MIKLLRRFHPGMPSYPVQVVGESRMMDKLSSLLVKTANLITTGQLD